MIKNKEHIDGDNNAAPAPLLKRLAAALADPGMYDALQHVMNGSPQGRAILADILLKAQTRYNAPHIEELVRDIVPEGIKPYDYLGIEREDFIKSVLAIPNPYPIWMNARTPEEKLKHHVRAIDWQVKFLAQLRSELSQLSTQKKIVLHDFVDGKFDHYLSTESWQGFKAIRIGAPMRSVNLFMDVLSMTDQDFIALRNISKVGFKAMGEIIAFKVLADKTDGFKTLAALQKPLELDLPANVVPFARPKTP